MPPFARSPVDFEDVVARVRPKRQTLARRFLLRCLRPRDSQLGNLQVREGRDARSGRDSTVWQSYIDRL